MGSRSITKPRAERPFQYDPYTGKPFRRKNCKKFNLKIITKDGSRSGTIGSGELDSKGYIYIRLKPFIVLDQQQLKSVGAVIHLFPDDLS